MFGAIVPSPSAEERAAIEQALRPPEPRPARSAWWRRGVLESTGAAEPGAELADDPGAETPGSAGRPAQAGERPERCLRT